MTNTARWSIVASILILGLLVAVVPGMLAGPEEPEQTEVAVEKRPDCPNVGIELPCLAGNTVDGPKKPTVVNVWAWWCGPCREELPLFDALATEHPEWNVIGVHADTNEVNGATFLNSMNLHLPSLQDDSNYFAGTYGLPGVVPITVVFDAEGNLKQSFPSVFASGAELEEAVAGALR